MNVVAVQDGAVLGWAHAVHAHQRAGGGTTDDHTHAPRSAQRGEDGHLPAEPRCGPVWWTLTETGMAMVVLVVLVLRREGF